MKIILEVKPLLHREAWQGRKYRTKKHLDYEEECGYLLLKYPKNKFKPEDRLEVFVKFYLKYAKATDSDNPVKPLFDILTKNQIISDDRQIWKHHIEKIQSNEHKIEIKIRKIKI